MKNAIPLAAALLLVAIRSVAAQDRDFKIKVEGDLKRIAIIGFSQGSVAAFTIGARSSDVKVLGLVGFAAGRRRGWSLGGRRIG